MPKTADEIAEQVSLNLRRLEAHFSLSSYDLSRLTGLAVYRIERAEDSSLDLSIWDALAITTSLNLKIDDLYNLTEKEIAGLPVHVIKEVSSL